MTTKKDIELIEKELLHSLKEEDNQALLNWRKERPEHTILHDHLTEPQMSVDIETIGNEMKNEIWEAINHHIALVSRRTLLIKTLAIAASVVLLIGITNYISYKQGYKALNSQIVQIANPLGMKSSITLSDGTKVILNAGTVLSYPTVFTTRNREVEVSGEAYFEVAHDVEHPFIVRAENIKVKVLGTKFNVKAYKEEKDIEVTLAEGKIAVGSDKKEKMIYMSPYQQVLYHKSNQHFTKKNVNLNYYTSWKDGKFYFNSLTFEEISTQLERRFNVTIQITSENLKKIVFTGDFVRGENLEQILKVMTADKRTTYKIENGLVRIYEN